MRRRIVTKDYGGNTAIETPIYQAPAFLQLATHPFQPIPRHFFPTNHSLTAPPGTKPWSSGATLEAERSPMRLAETAKQRIHQPLLPLTALLASQAPPAVLQIHIDKTNQPLTAACGDKTNPTRRSTPQITGTNPTLNPNQTEKTNPKSDTRQVGSLTRYRTIPRSLHPCAFGSVGCQPAAGPLAGLSLKSLKTTAGSTSGCKLTACTTGLGPRYPVPGPRRGSALSSPCTFAQIAGTNPNQHPNRPDKTNPALTAAFGGKTNPTRHSTSQIAGTNPNQPPNRPDKTNPPLTVASGFGGKTNPTRLATVQIAGTNPIRHLSAACNFLFTVGPACPAGRMLTADP